MVLVDIATKQKIQKTSFSSFDEMVMYLLSHRFISPVECGFLQEEEITEE